MLLGPLTPKGVEERLGESSFLGKLRHGAPVMLQQGGGSIPSIPSLLRVVCPLGGWNFHWDETKLLTKEKLPPV